MKVGIIGLGFVGGAMLKSFKLKGYVVVGHDKYKESGSFEDCLNTDIIFLCLPTQFDTSINQYDKSIIYDVCKMLVLHNYQGIVVNKSTVEPLTNLQICEMYPSLKLVHNPEFLTAVTAFEDFHHQKHIVLGKTENVTEEDIDKLVSFYKPLYPDAEISICNSTESESMKIFVNCFYSVKVQFFNELYLLCQKNNCDYNKVKDLMLKNGWINPMHTQVPGPDGKLSYGGYCFPKDTNALLQHMKNKETPNKVLEACIQERNEMREDNTNIIFSNSSNHSSSVSNCTNS